MLVVMIHDYLKGNVDKPIPVKSKSSDASSTKVATTMSGTEEKPKLTNPQGEDELQRTIFISNLPFDITIEEVKQRFSAFGGVETFMLVIHPVTKSLQPSNRRCYPEFHNLNGLVCESRCDYQGAVASYRLARYALKYFAAETSESHLNDISINLARSLCMIYVTCLWRLGKNDMALAATTLLASSILSMEENLAAASISFICKLLYNISGQESAITSILEMPKQLFSSSRISFFVSAIHVLDPNNQLESVVSSSRSFVTSRDEIISMHMLITLGKLLNNGIENSLGIQKGVDHL